MIETFKNNPYAFEYFDTSESKIFKGYIATLERIVNNVEKLKKWYIKNGDFSLYYVQMLSTIALRNHPS